MAAIKTWFKDLPIQRKINFAILLTCGTALAVTAAAFFQAQLAAFQRNFTRDLETTGAMMAHACAPALVAHDQAAAARTLQAIEFKPHIIFAQVTLREGMVLASFTRHGEFHLPEGGNQAGFQSLGPYLVLNQPILINGERVGMLRIVSNYQKQFGHSLSIYAVILGGVLVVSVLLALAISTRLQRLISRPILALARTAQQVADGQDYSVRAEKFADDEVGRLTDAFNEMLAKTEHDGAALREVNRKLEAEIAQHQHTEHALQASEAFMHSLVQSLPQNIVRKDLEGRFTFVNEFFCRTVGRTKEDILGMTDFDIFPADLAGKFRRDDKRVLSTGKQLETVEESINHAGKKIYVQAIKAPVLNAANECIGLQTIFWDVTERKEAEEAVEKLHKQLLLTSREAGMAEVATGVLHNVGNVLNSVNVAVTVVESRLRQSRIRNLGKALGLIREHREDLASFLANDSKGKMLPAYLESLAEHLSAEHEEMAHEIAQLSKNVDHIKQIVAMQQSYAKLCGVTENVQASELAEDAIRMNLGAFERHGVHIVREYDVVPAIQADRHKVLQILVNLMRNAKYAMDELEPAQKTMVVSISAKGQDRVLIRVRDNGIGIAPENLTRIFGHGFTTKRDGHGFGLHSGALAAKEMGGELSAASDGPGSGAVFSLELPVAPAVATEQSTEGAGCAAVS